MTISFVDELPEGFDWLRCRNVLLIRKSLPLSRRLEIIADHDSERLVG